MTQLGNAAPAAARLDAAAAQVVECFAAYEAALAAADVASMNEWFLDDDAVIRFGVAEEQHGAAQIRAWRRSSPSVPAGRTLTATKVVARSPDLVVVTTLFGYPHSSAIGRQSQVWVRTDATWRIAHAHVSERPADITRTVPAKPLGSESAGGKR
jgi:ketosteroid isomerase-like protein